MPRMLVLVVAALAWASPREAAACFEPQPEPHALDRSQLADAVQPAAPSVSVWIEEAQDGGCSGVENPCAAGTGRRLVLMVAANDDRTPPDKLGFRIGGMGLPFAVTRDMRPVGDLIWFPIADDLEVDFEVSVRAVDLNGNVGPATYVHAAEANGGCAARSGTPMSFALIAIALGLLVRRRRR